MTTQFMAPGDEEHKGTSSEPDWELTDFAVLALVILAVFILGFNLHRFLPWVVA
jgi:hypothetical protein